MSCELWKDRLDAYIDAELPSDEMTWCAEHLRSCAACASESLNRMQLKRMTQLAGKKFVASPDFRARIQRQASGAAKPAFFWNWGTKWAIAAALVLIISLFSVQIVRSQKQQALSELADLHVADLASANPVDVVSTDRHTVKPWFQGKLPFTFNLPELANTQFTLIGGRVTYFHQNPGAHLLYEIRKHKMSVLVFQDRPELSNAAGSSISTGKLETFNVRSWAANGLRFYLITDASANDADQLQKLFEAEGRI
jgi:anti-sigma factor RsiW